MPWRAFTSEVDTIFRAMHSLELFLSCFPSMVDIYLHDLHPLWVGTELMPFAEATSEVVLTHGRRQLVFISCSPSQGTAGGTGHARSFWFGKQITVREKIWRRQNKEWKVGSKEWRIIHIFSKCKTYLEPMKLSGDISETTKRQCFPPNKLWNLLPLDAAENKCLSILKKTWTVMKNSITGTHWTWWIMPKFQLTKPWATNWQKLEV